MTEQGLLQKIQKVIDDMPESGLARAIAHIETEVKTGDLSGLALPWADEPDFTKVIRIITTYAYLQGREDARETK